MSTFANVFVGNVANDGSGDQLRTAFLKIDENFAKIASGEIGVTVNAPIQRVAGRSQANIILSVADVNGAVGNLRVNALDANVGTITTDITTLFGDISDIEVEIAKVNANVTAANAAIADFVAGTGFASEAQLTANVTTLQHEINLVNANVTASNTRVSGLATTVSSHSSSIAILQSNDSAQTTSLNRIDANLGVATNNITTLQSNASIQATALNQINSALVITNSDVAGLRANIIAANIVNASQASSIASINNNITDISDELVILDANLGVATNNITALKANAGVQATAINLVNANVSAINLTTLNNSANIIALQTNAIGVATSINLVNANTATNTNNINQNTASITAANTHISTVETSLGTTITDVNNLKASIAAANIVISTKAPINAPTFIGNVTTGNILAQGFFWANGTPFTSDSALVSQANIGMKAYVDAQDSALGSRINAANSAIVSANVAMKIYVDSYNVSWNANAGSQQTQINNLTSSISTVANLSALGGSLIPSTANIYSIGSTTKPWGNVYASNISAISGEFHKVLNNETYTYGNTTTLGRMTVTDGVFWANGTPFTTVGGSYGNIEVVAQLQHLTTDVTTTGNVYSRYLIGDGSLLTGLDDLDDLTSYGGNIQADTIVANSYVGNGSGLTNVPSTFTTANVAAYMNTPPAFGGYTGNITANIYTDNIFYANGVRRQYSDPQVQLYLNSGAVTNVITGNLAVLTGNLLIGANTPVVSSVARQVYVNTSAPLSSQGNVGDIWYQTY